MIKTKENKVNSQELTAFSLKECLETLDCIFLNYVSTCPLFLILGLLLMIFLLSYVHQYLDIMIMGPFQRNTGFTKFQNLA